MVLKRRKDYDEASEQNAWRLLAEVSFSEERFQEVRALMFEAIATCADGNEAPLEEPEPPVEESDPINKGSSSLLTGNQECIVLQ